MNSLKIVSRFISLIIIISVIWYAVSNWGKLDDVTLSEPLYILPAVLLTCLNTFFSGRILDAVLEHRDIKLSYKETFGLSAITRFGNYVSTGYLGTSLRGVYLKKNFSVPFSSFSGGFLFSNFVQLATTGGLGVLILLLQPSEGLDGSLYPFILFIIVSLLATLFFPAGPIKKIQKHLEASKNKPLHLLSKALKEYLILRSRPAVLIRLVVWTLAALFASAGSLFCFFKAVDANLIYSQALFMSIAANWAIVVSITPANIGVGEGFLALGAKIIGVSIPQTLVVAVLQRVVNFLVLALLSLIFTPILYKRSFFKIKEVTRNQ